LTGLSRLLTRQVLVLTGFAFLLAACSTGNLNRGGFGNIGTGQSAQFDAIGSGTVKIGLLLPITANGNAGRTAKALKEAAELALFTFNNPDIILIPKDTRGTAAGAAAAATELVNEGAELIIGPVFAESVSAASAITRQANIPMIAFSTDSNVAGRGVYLLSFLPENDINQIIAYAVAQGKRSFAAILPQNAYGTIVQGAFQQAVLRNGGQVVAIETYPLDRQGMMEPAQRISEVANGDTPQADAILIPDGPNVIPSLTPLLTIHGVKPDMVKFLGSGQWDDERARREPSLRGGWYPSADPTGFQEFSNQFQATYGSEPPRLASLAYDAVNLVSTLATQPQGQRFTDAALTNPGGFQGVDGIFRFLTNGLNERGLSIMEVTEGGGNRVLQPAPQAFGPRAF